MNAAKTLLLFYHFTINRIFVGFILFSFLFVLITSCKSSKSTASSAGAGEDFNTFYDKFLTDSIFQMKRIKFPLPGINTAAMELEEDSVYHWKKEDWYMLRKPEIDPDVYTRKLNISDTLVTDEIFIENSGFYIKSVFKPIKRKWFLTYFVDSNI